MNVFVKRAKKGAFKLALHYDTEQSVGIIVNYTYRNILLNRSRFWQQWIFLSVLKPD
jgi:NTE family protein